jgi:hypothetical protein
MAQIFGFSGISLTTQRGKQKRILVNTHARTHTHAPKHADTQTFTHASAHPRASTSARRNNGTKQTFTNAFAAIKKIIKMRKRLHETKIKRF